MVTKRKQHSSRRPVKQGPDARAPRPNKIGAATPYHFRGKNLTPRVVQCKMSLKGRELSNAR